MSGCIAPETSHLHELMVARTDGRLLWRCLWNPAQGPPVVPYVNGNAAIIDLCMAEDAA